LNGVAKALTIIALSRDNSGKSHGEAVVHHLHEATGAAGWQAVRASAKCSGDGGGRLRA